MLKGIDIKANRQWNQARKRGPSKNTKLRLCLDILKVFFHVWIFVSKSGNRWSSSCHIIVQDLLLQNQQTRRQNTKYYYLLLRLLSRSYLLPRFSSIFLHSFFKDLLKFLTFLALRSKQGHQKEENKKQQQQQQKRGVTWTATKAKVRHRRLLPVHSRRGLSVPIVSLPVLTESSLFPRQHRLNRMLENVFFIERAREACVLNHTGDRACSNGRPGSGSRPERGCRSSSGERVGDQGVQLARTLAPAVIAISLRALRSFPSSAFSSRLSTTHLSSLRFEIFIFGFVFPPGWGLADELVGRRILLVSDEGGVAASGVGRKAWLEVLERDWNQSVVGNDGGHGGNGGYGGRRRGGGTEDCAVVEPNSGLAGSSSTHSDTTLGSSAADDAQVCFPLAPTLRWQAPPSPSSLHPVHWQLHFALYFIISTSRNPALLLSDSSFTTEREIDWLICCHGLLLPSSMRQCSWWRGDDAFSSPGWSILQP